MSDAAHEEHVIRSARSDATYALTMAQQPEASVPELRALIGKLAGAVQDVAEVADMRGERLNNPAARALEQALRSALHLPGPLA